MTGENGKREKMKEDEKAVAVSDEEEEDEESDVEEFIDIPVRDENGEESDEMIAIPIRPLPSFETVLQILTQEEASLDKWVTVAVEYYRQGNLVDFESVMNVGCSTEVAERYSDDVSGQLQMLNSLAAYKISLEGSGGSGLDVGNGVSKTSAGGSHLAEAVELLQRADRLDDRESLTWVNKGVLSLVQGAEDTALQNFDTAIGHDSKNLLAKLGKGTVLFKKKQFAAARDQFKRAIREHPGCHASVRVNLGLCYYELGNEERAIECFKRTLDLDEDEINAQVALAVVELSQSQRQGFDTELMKRGMKRLRTVYELQPNNAIVLTHLANHFFFKKKPESREYSRIETLARKAYKSTHIPETKAEAAYMLGRNFHEQGDIDAAMQFYQRALEHWPGFTLAQFAKAQMLLARSESVDVQKGEQLTSRGKALDILDKILRDNEYKGDRDVNMFAAWVHIRANRRSMATTLLRQVTASDPGDTEAWLEQCRVMQKEKFLSKKQKKESVRAYIKAAEGMEPVPSFIYTNLGELKFSLGDVRGALQVFREGLEANKEAQTSGDAQSMSKEDEITLRFDLARVLEEVGGMDEAEDMYKKLHEELPNYTEPLLRLGAMSERHGRMSEAEQYYKTATKTKTDPDNAWVMLGLLAQKRGELKQAKALFSKVNKGEGRGDPYSKLCQANIAMDSVRMLKKKDPEIFAEGVKSAKRTYYKLLERENGNVFAATGLANGLAAQDFLAEARQIYERLREPDDVVNPSVWINLGHIAMEDGRFDTAVSLYQQTLKRFNLENDIELLLYLASALVCTEKFEEARSVLLRAVKIDPSDLRLRYNLAMLMLRQGKQYCDSKEEKRTLKGMLRTVACFEDAGALFQWLAETKSGAGRTSGASETKAKPASKLFLQAPRPPRGKATAVNKEYLAKITAARKSAVASFSSAEAQNQAKAKDTATAAEGADKAGIMRPLGLRAPKSTTFKQTVACAESAKLANKYRERAGKFVLAEHRNEEERKKRIERMHEANEQLERERQELAKKMIEETEKAKQEEEKRAQESMEVSRKLAEEFTEMNRLKNREKEEKKASRQTKAKDKRKKKGAKAGEEDDFVVDDEGAEDDIKGLESDSSSDASGGGDRDFDPSAVKKRRKAAAGADEDQGDSDDEESEAESEGDDDDDDDIFNDDSDADEGKSKKMKKAKKKKKKSKKAKGKSKKRKSQSNDDDTSATKKRKIRKRAASSSDEEDGQTAAASKADDIVATENDKPSKKRKVMAESDEEDEVEF